MTPSEIIRHNAKIILSQVRGKSEPARRLHYAVLQVGPLAPLQLIAECVVKRRADEMVRRLVNGVVKDLHA
mgnify:CR=1 FL=1